MNQDITQLEARIKSLEDAVSKRAINQIQYPLDEISKTVLGKSSTTGNTIGLSGTVTTTGVLTTGLSPDSRIKTSLIVVGSNATDNTAIAIVCATGSLTVVAAAAGKTINFMIIF